MRGYFETNNKDEYAQVAALQVNGIPCPYCQSMSGHYGKCSLLNRAYPVPEKLHEKTMVWNEPVTQDSPEVIQAEKYNQDVAVTNFEFLTANDYDRIFLEGIQKR